MRGYEQLTQEMIDEAIGNGYRPNGNDVIAFNVFTMYVFGSMAVEIQRWRLPVDVVVIGSEVLEAVREDDGQDIIPIENELRPERLCEGVLRRWDLGYSGAFVGTVFNIPLYQNLGSWLPDPGDVYFFTEPDFLFGGDGINPRGLVKGMFLT